MILGAKFWSTTRVLRSQTKGSCVDYFGNALEQALANIFGMGLEKFPFFFYCDVLTKIQMTY